MKRIAITGGIGCGKTTITNDLEIQSSSLAPLPFKSIRFIDADMIAHYLMKRHSEAGVFEKLAQRFPSAVGDEEINRHVLGSIVFATPNSPDLQALNEIIHPAVISEINKWLHHFEQEDKAEFGVVAIPLLHEVAERYPSALKFDATICVACSRQTQIRRLTENRKMSEAQAIAMIDAQFPIERKMSLSDFVIWNENGNAWCQQAQAIFDHIFGTEDHLLTELATALKWCLHKEPSPCRCVDFATPPHICTAHRAIKKIEALLQGVSVKS